MSTIVDSNLAGFTVDYNGVQFGGADSDYSSHPPYYRLVGTPVYDDSSRTIKWVKFTLFVRCVFYALSESSMGSDQRNIRLALMQPGKQLRLSGLGSGFDWIARPISGKAGDMIDVAWGPKPGAIEMTSHGQLSWELAWSCEFTVVPCMADGSATNNLALLSFNFATTWVNDFEGMSQRRITGSCQVAGLRDYTAPKTPVQIAEQTRGGIIVVTPPGYRRTSNVWSESLDHTTLTFDIVDEQLKGDALPPGITQGASEFSFDSGGEGNQNMARSVCTLNMVLKTAYDKPRNYAGQVFMAAAMSKQAELSAVDPVTGKPTITVVPLHLHISNRKFDDCRVTSGSLSWVVTKTLSECMAAAKIWEPVSALLTGPLGGSQDYTAWRASMSNMWNNRGTSQQQELLADAVVIDVCDNAYNGVGIGSVGSNPNVLTDASLPSLTCPTIPDNGGWAHFDLDIKFLRRDLQTQHRRATSYVPTNGTTAYTYDAQPGSGDGGINIGGPAVPQSDSDQHVTEYHGYPETWIGLTFSGLRFKNKPFLPEIKTVGGFPVIHVDSQGDTPKHVMDSFGCPVWAVSGYRVYRVPGYIGSIKPVTSLVATDTSVPLDL